jgi:ABC-2 type transport system ATP-binding protein
LSLSGLGDTGKKKARDFSLGMKQRLGLAMALLHEPELIILDILAELSQLSTHYGIIHKGRLARQLSAEELNCECAKCLAIKMSDVKEGLSVLKKSLHLLNYQAGLSGEIRLFGLNDLAPQVNRTLIEAGIDVRELRPAGQDLESYFLEATGGLK